MGCGSSAQRLPQLGDIVVIQNIRDPAHAHINGYQGTVTSWDVAKQRWNVRGVDGTPYLLKPDCLKVVKPFRHEPVSGFVQSTPRATCNMGHSLDKSRVVYDPHSRDENLRRPILCDDCFDTLPEDEREKAIIHADVAWQCMSGCDFALCERHYNLRVHGQRGERGRSSPSSSRRPQVAPITDGVVLNAPQDQPDTKKIMVADPRQAKGQSVGVIAFYFPGHPTVWDNICKAGFLGNFWDIRPEALRVRGLGEGGAIVTHSFGNAEAAFQALKFWGQANSFERLSGDEAFQEKRRLAGSEDRTYAGHGSNWAGMWAVLKSKFEARKMQSLLLKTEDAYLLEHNSITGRDEVWSDNCDGQGMNWLGLQLMLLRDELRKSPKLWTQFIQEWIDPASGAFRGPTGESQWRSTVHRARKALVDEIDKQYPGQQLPTGGFRCRKAGCGKPTYNGQPNDFCSKLCKTSKFMSYYSSRPTGGGGMGVMGGGFFMGSSTPSRPAICSKPGCGKPTWNGQPNEYCSRSCRSEDQPVSSPFPAQPATSMAMQHPMQPTQFVTVQHPMQPTQFVTAQAVSAYHACMRPGCGKPTWNGAPNEFCSKVCRQQMQVPQPQHQPWGFR